MALGLLWGIGVSAMIDALFSQPSYVTASKLLDTTALRHEAISSNIANLETPGYKRVDIAPSFNDELRRALATHDASAISGLEPRVQVDALAVSVGPDGNTVQVEDELMRMSENTMLHSLNAQTVSGMFDRLQLAITGRKV
jgi:flagellar basal-body rod protein FlgB